MDDKERLKLEHTKALNALDYIKGHLRGLNREIETFERKKRICEENISKLRFELNQREEDK